MSTIETFIETSFQNVRSSKRTDELHKALLAEALLANHDWIDQTGNTNINCPLTALVAPLILISLASKTVS